MVYAAACYGCCTDRDHLCRLASALANSVARHRMTGLVNNAGLNHIQRLGEIELAAFDEVIAVNLRAAI